MDFTFVFFDLERNSLFFFPVRISSKKSVLITKNRTSGFNILFGFFSGCLFCRFNSFVIFLRLLLAIVLIYFSVDGPYFRSFPDDLGLLRLEGVVEVAMVFEL